MSLNKFIVESWLKSDVLKDEAEILRRKRKEKEQENKNYQMQRAACEDWINRLRFLNMEKEMINGWAC